MNEDPRDHELDAAYRRASEADAGRPSASTRAAIRAQAEASARRRTPAANDPRFRWGAVAAVAVIGIGVLIWRQTDVRMPGEFPAPEVMMEVQSGTTAAQARADEVEVNAARESRRAPAPSADSIQAPVTAEVQPAAPPPPPPPAVMAQVSEFAPAASAAGLGADESLRLVREHFPDQYQGTRFHRLWLVRDGDGNVLQSGELQPSQDWSHVEEQLRGLQGHTPGPWRRQQLRNAAGQLIELSISDVQMGEPRR